MIEQGYDIDQIVSTTHHTVDMLLQYKNWPDALALYFRYIKQRKMQDNVNTYSTDVFMRKAMWWWKDRFQKAKKILRDLGMIETNSTTDENWKIIGWYVKVNFMITRTPDSQTLGLPDSGKQETNTLVYNINTLVYKENTNTSSTDTNTQSNTKDVDVKKKTPKKKRTTHSYTKEFEEFWKIYPHARKSKKSDAKKFFKDQDSAEVLKEATLLRYKIEFGIEDSRYLPACERWIRDFVPSADVVVIDNLKKIMKLVAEMPVWEKRSKIVKDFSESYWKSVVDKVFKDVNSKRLQTIER